MRSPPDRLIQTSSCELFAIWLPYFPESFPHKWHHRIILVPIVCIVFFQRNCLVDLCTGDRYWLEIGELRREAGGNKGEPREGGMGIEEGDQGGEGEPVGDKQGDIESEKMAPLYRNEKCIWCSRKIAFHALCARIRPLPVIYPWLLRWVQHSKPLCLKIRNEMRFMRMKRGISQKPYSISESTTSYRRASEFEVDEWVITSARCWDFDLAILWTT